jgi:hypothetical protein
VELGPDAGVAVEGTQPDADLVAPGPLVAEEARAANRAERLDAAVIWPEDADQLLAGEQAEPLPRDPALGLAEGAGVLAAP